MEKKTFYGVVSIIMIIGLISISFLSLVPEEDLDSPILSIDYCSKPINDLNDLENGTMWVEYKDYAIIPTLDSEMAGDNGNLYAPEILIEDGIYKMWYGAQSSDGHDSIHFATSDDGKTWMKYGVVIPTGENNHVNDPSVVKVDDVYYMYYTVAPEAELDEIWVATSNNGFNWTIYGKVLDAAEDAEEWDSLKVGRPSVLYEGGIFKMWFDGSQRNATDPKFVREGTGRHVGYATSADGFNWIKYANNPIFNNSGAIDVENIGGSYIIVEESGDGVLYRIGSSETDFPESNGWLFHKMNSSFDRYGHVTPFILIKGGKWVATYTGAATKSNWAQNRISIWYPMYNITANKVDSNNIMVEIDRPWAYSNELMQWTLDAAFYNSEIRLDLGFQNQILASTTINIDDAATRCFLQDMEFFQIP